MAMSAKDFLATVSEEEAARVCAAAGTKLVYLTHISKGYRNASTKLAQKLVEASGGRLDAMALMTATHARDSQESAA